MNDIFDGVQPKKLSKEELTAKIRLLRGEGKSWRECEKILDTPQTTLRRVCQSVPETPPSVPKSALGVPDVPQGNDKDYVTIGELKRCLAEFEESLLLKVESAVQKVVTYKIQQYIENTLNPLVNKIINEKMEANERS